MKWILATFYTLLISCLCLSLVFTSPFPETMPNLLDMPPAAPGEAGLIFHYEPGRQISKDLVSKTPWTQTYAGTNRTRINSAGLLEAVAINTPVIDHLGASLVPAIRLEPAAANLLFGSNTFTAAAGWTLVSATTVDNGDGTYTVTDASAAVFGHVKKSISKSASDSTTYFQISVFVKKTSGATSFPGLYLGAENGTNKLAAYTINTNTGVITAKSDNSLANIGGQIESKGNFWKASLWATDNGSNTVVVWAVFAAVNTDASAAWAAAAQGSCVIANGKLTTGSIPSSYFAGAAAQGAEQATGTTTINKPYLITATQADYFGTGLIVGQYFISATEIALDANNKVKEHGTVRLSEANTVTLAMASIPDVAAMLAAGTGTIVIKGRFAFARAAGVVTNILASQDATASLAYTTTAAGNLSSFDETAVAESTGAYTANVDWKIAITFPSDTDKYRIGVDANGAGIVQGAEVAFDGAFTATANLILCRVLHGATWIKYIQIYDKVLTDAQINAL